MDSDGSLTKAGYADPKGWYSTRENSVNVSVAAWSFILFAASQTG